MFTLKVGSPFQAKAPSEGSASALISEARRGLRTQRSGGGLALGSLPVFQTVMALSVFCCGYSVAHIRQPTNLAALYDMTPTGSIAPKPGVPKAKLCD